MTKDSGFCYLTSQNPCGGATPVKCSETSEKLRTMTLFDEARRIPREVPVEKQPRLELIIDFPPREAFGSACVIC
jgi:hypothetical protein